MKLLLMHFICEATKNTKHWLENEPSLGGVDNLICVLPTDQKH